MLNKNYNFELGNFWAKFCAWKAVSNIIKKIAKSYKILALVTTIEIVWNISVATYLHNLGRTFLNYQPRWHLEITNTYNTYR